MSSVVAENPVDYGALGADLVETSTGRKIKEASAVRWVWQPFKDIPLFDQLGPAVRNNLTLREKREKRDGVLVTVSDPVTELRRCQPYPLTNCEYEVSRHEAKRYGNFGEELTENELPGNYSGADPKSEGAPVHIVEPKFAYSCARELSEMYAATHGLVVLEPVTGVEDGEIIRQIFQMVQPVTYRLHVLEHELKVGAPERIKEAKGVSKEVKDLARGTRELMLKGFAKAWATATEHGGDFSRQVQLATSGQKGNRAFPAPYDEFVFEQLGLPVPRVVQTEKRDDGLLARLVDKLELGRENEALDRALAMLEEEREARKALEEKVNKLLAKGA